MVMNTHSLTGVLNYDEITTALFSIYFLVDIVNQNYVLDK